MAHTFGKANRAGIRLLAGLYDPENFTYHRSTTFPISRGALQRTYHKHVQSCDGLDGVAA